MVSLAWKELSPAERAPWEEMARKDKARFQLEKSVYDGPWKVPDVKDPSAPKRPVSAFLLFSKAKREKVKRDGRYRTAIEISTALSQMWKEASAEERSVYTKRDLEDRQRYKRELLEYKAVISEGRYEREALAAKAVEDDGSTMSLIHADNSELTRFVADQRLRRSHCRLEPVRSLGPTSPPGPSNKDSDHGDDTSCWQPVGSRREWSDACTEVSGLDDPDEQRCEVEVNELLADFTKFMDKVEGGTTDHSGPPPDTVDWDPIPLDEVGSNCCDNDCIGEAVLTPIATRSTMDDGYYTPPVITPLQLSVTPKVSMYTTRHGYPVRQYPMIQERLNSRAYRREYSSPYGNQVTSYHPYQYQHHYDYPPPEDRTSK
jgi:HMG (high mobility group) box